MNWFENLLIVAGIGLDIFATMEIQGAMIAQVKKKALIIAFAVVAGLQLLFYLIGYNVFRLLGVYGYIKQGEKYGQIVAVIVFGLLGVRLLVKAIKREIIQEHRRDQIRVWDYIRIITVTSLYTLAAGSVCGLLGTTIWQLILLVLIVSVVEVVGGIYTGLHFGFENKTLAYVIGAILLLFVGFEIFCTRVL